MCVEDDTINDGSSGECADVGVTTTGGLRLWNIGQRLKSTKWDTGTHSDESRALGLILNVSDLFDVERGEGTELRRRSLSGVS